MVQYSHHGCYVLLLVPLNLDPALVEEVAAAAAAAVCSFVATYT